MMDGRAGAWRVMSCVLVVAAMVGMPVAAAPAQTADTSATAAEDQSASADTSSEEDSARVLRHAVFFKFKDGTAEEDVQRVVEAFGALPAKIPEIADFEWGENQSSAAHGSGLTHCFLLTFHDEAGRAAYLPHADHKAFGDVLRPHLDRVFVVDYWGTPTEQDLAKPLRHLVFFKFRDDATPADVQAIEEAFAALPAKIDAIRGFEWGRNNSPESHDEGFTHCFLVSFDSEEGLAEYARHPEHTAFATMLRPTVEKARVIDYRAEPGDTAASR